MNEGINFRQLFKVEFIEKNHYVLDIRNLFIRECILFILLFLFHVQYLLLV